MLDERAYIIIQKMLERPFIEKKDLQKQTSLTQRQIDYSLDKINTWLCSNRYKPIILNNHDQLSADYQTREILLKEISNSFPINEYILNRQERVKFIYLLLFLNTEYVSMNHFTTALKVGKTTIMNDLKALEVNLMEKQISVEYNRKKGYQLEGAEFSIRYLMMRMIFFDLNEDNNTQLLDHFLHTNQLDEYEATKKTIVHLLKKHHISFVENRLTEFIYSFLFIKERLKKTRINTVSADKFTPLKNMKEYAFSKELLQSFQYDKEEGIYYLSALILGLSMGETSEKTADYDTIMNLVEHIRNRFESFSGIRFDHPENVAKQLYRHFRPVYYRLYFRFPIVNPLGEKIKKEYHNLYRIVHETLKPIGAIFGSDIPEEEVAFLTMHFASLATTLHDEKTKQKVALIVCPNGVGSSSITYTVLQSIFPEFRFLVPIETSDIEKMDGQYDVVFSTVPNIRLFYTKKPVYIVSPIMNSAEKYRLIRDVYTEIGSSFFKLPSVEYIIQIVEKYAKITDKELLKRELYKYFVINDNISLEKDQYPKLSEMTSPTLIQLNMTANDWQEAIAVSAKPLVKEQRITEEYVEKMIDNANKSGPYMVIMKHVALPHARPVDGVKQLSIGITVFKDPIFFDNHASKPVKYVFCLAAIDQERHLNALSQLVLFLENDDFYALLNNSEDAKEVYHYICQNES
ncbi:Transcriptional antiterminator [Evansella caseinilytica]|uniref:Ascorbate-specific PTS system EIIA component n=1 Tax=Evansella caseinilytica TaxID=1503961 RepID=A0A1H3UT88_9BACI|nr:BglG family transcription antiterminator [Evansella caseinilytica]SDZ65660.1 Transcriptional antiterminator [Evansella caseinilytica]